MLFKLRLLLSDFKEGGIVYGLKRIILFLFQPITSLIRRHRFLTELRYGILPKAKFLIPFYSVKSGLVEFPQTDLLKVAREFWYKNIPGYFDLDYNPPTTSSRKRASGEKISRKEIFLYGGPDPKFTCLICQKAEWLSRVRQKNLFIPHLCQQAKECQTLCSRQGDELWTHFHQNFDFSFGCDSNLPAPKCLYLIHKGKENFLNPRCEPWLLVTRRRLAYACQVDVVDKPIDIVWSNYDFLFTINGGNNPKFPRPNIPIIMYGHDFWPLEDKGFQWVIDWLRPDVFLTVDPTPWQENFKMPSQTKVVFYPFFDSLFFARPNLDEKQFDLLAIGAVTHSIYRPRELLNKQIIQFFRDNKNRYRIEISKIAGSNNVLKKGSVIKKDSETGLPTPLLNKWSEYLGQARYVIFGKMEYPSLTYKHFEVLGSGAISIFPETPDLKYLGVRPFEHYIPLSEVEGNNQKLAYFLNHYEKYKYIAENAVNWYKENSDRMIFNDFEDLIREITGSRFPKRLI